MLTSNNLNIMKLYKYILLIPMLLLASCDLDKEPYGISNFWNTEADVWLGLNACYDPYYYEEGFGRGQFWVGPASDDMIINKNNPTVDQLTKFTTPTNSNNVFYKNWQLLYRSIKRANDVMANAPGVTMSDKSRDLIMGEANYICAFDYFFLAKRYGGLPFYDWQKPLEINKPRETKTETYKRIEAYLLTAIKHFEAQDAWTRDKDDYGRPNLGAAYGLLAKVYAHWGKYTEAKAAAEKVILSGKYSLNTANNNGYANLFSISGEKHEEVLFNLNNKAIRNQGTVTSVVLLSGKLSGGTGWSYFPPTQSLYNAFEPGDLRRKVTLVGAGDVIHYLGKETTLTTDLISDMATGYMCAKFGQPYDDLTSWNWEAGKDIPLLRYADILLIHAEAEIFLAGGGPNARTKGVSAAAESFNQVRLRAFGGDMSKAITAPTFNDLVKERRCELAYEDERHFDLVRWGIATEVYGSTTTALDPRGPRVFDPVKNAHFPLPQKEIENTDNLLVNNPKEGYSSFE